MNKNAPLIGFAVIVLGIIVAIVGVTYQQHTSEGINSNNIPAVGQGTWFSPPGYNVEFDTDFYTCDEN
jgi:hypothetical protein